MAETKHQDEDKSAENNRDKSMSLLSRSLITGFVGGVIWSILGVVMYYFSFSEVAAKSFVLRSWLVKGWTDGWLGDVISILLTGVLSVFAALVYYGLFKKINSIWLAAGFGVVLWVIIFYVFHPIFDNVPPVTDLNMNTIVSTLCLFVLYGTFIGYSISYDYHDTIVKEQRES
ncbi:YqhR family membrane protein [Lentibacillus sp. Marseille-P4043]|uniref:YqhR family membrane protein n=1 Tax=Lentibacillus sp. Marseille-P4043 TaxID=2040293 RepID=UPI001F2925FC|nr:YqhR family membrane protein [Lentibacillus sp. Marseille-P4043]